MAGSTRFKGGSFYLALEGGMPVVPISVVGSRHVMLKGRLATYPGRVRLVVHEPIDTRGLEDMDAEGVWRAHPPDHRPRRRIRRESDDIHSRA